MLPTHRRVLHILVMPVKKGFKLLLGNDAVPIGVNLGKVRSDSGVGESALQNSFALSKLVQGDALGVIDVEEPKKLLSNLLSAGGL